MAAENSELVSLRSKSTRSGPTSRELVQESDSKELFFAVVGHVGSGTSQIAKELEKVLSSSENGPAFDVVVLKARDELLAWDEQHKRLLDHAGETGTLHYAEVLQDVGNEMRGERSDHAAVAGALIRRIRRTRAEKTEQDPATEEPILPDGQWRAYILDSVRHPAEAELLCRIYQDAFVLIGVVCEEPEREDRLTKHKFREAGHDPVREFMLRDAKDKPKNGQRVSDAFHLAHFFLDNTEKRELDRGEQNPHWTVADQLSRLKKILTKTEVVRPRVSETAMFAAHGARLRSACLSRQVGASIVDRDGNVVSLGTNEVPRAGGGVYGTSDDRTESEGNPDKRCFHSNRYCSNNREQDRIVGEILSSLKASRVLREEVDEHQVEAALKRSPIGSLLEFSRAVHAEMDALLSLARRGLSVVGTRVFVTTFPCHYCARHLVGAGVDEVQFIEPYPKSRALDLHEDAIVKRAAEWIRPSDGGTKVLFRPFVGIAPRLYSRVFTKDRALKDERGSHRIGRPEWTEPTHLGQLSYLDLEAKIAGISA